MNIIIIGAGQVGGTLAEHLAGEENDITVIELQAEILDNLKDRIDIRSIEGNGCHPDVLHQAGAEDADMLIAVTDHDESNMMACQMAYTLFRVPTKIARIRSPHYLAHSQLFANEAIPIDHLISPEKLVTDYVQKLIEFPGALQVLDFAKGRVQLVAIKPSYGGALIGKTISEIHEHMPDLEARFVAIFRKNKSVPVKEDTAIEIGDEVFFIASSHHIRAIMNALRRSDEPNRRIVIAGGGNIGFCLASALEQDFQVKTIEHNTRRAKWLSEALDKTIVLLGDCADRELLVDEDIEHTDVFCAVTNDDEANIMSALQAKRLGARKVMALITRTAYVDLIEGGDIDIAISPQQATISKILKHIRRGDVMNVYSLRRGAAEAIEVIAHGDEDTSKVVGRTIADIKLPPGVTIGAVVKGNQVEIARDETLIESDDHVILFLEDKRYIHQVEQLFQVNINYI